MHYDQIKIESMQSISKRIQCLRDTNDSNTANQNIKDLESWIDNQNEYLVAKEKSYHDLPSKLKEYVEQLLSPASTSYSSSLNHEQETNVFNSDELILINAILEICANNPTNRNNGNTNNRISLVQFSEELSQMARNYDIEFSTTQEISENASSNYNMDVLRNILKQREKLISEYGDLFAMVDRTINPKNNHIHEKTINQNILPIKIVHRIISAKNKIGNDIHSKPSHKSEEHEIDEQSRSKKISICSLKAPQTCNNTSLTQNNMNHHHQIHTPLNEHNNIPIFSESSAIDLFESNRNAHKNIVYPPVENIEAYRNGIRSFKLKWKWPKGIDGVEYEIMQNGEVIVRGRITCNNHDSLGETEYFKLPKNGPAKAVTMSYRNVNGKEFLGFNTNPYEFGERFMIHCELSQRTFLRRRVPARLKIETDGDKLPELVIRTEGDREVVRINQKNSTVTLEIPNDVKNFIYISFANQADSKKYEIRQQKIKVL